METKDASFKATIRQHEKDLGLSELPQPWYVLLCIAATTGVGLMMLQLAGIPDQDAVAILRRFIIVAVTAAIWITSYAIRYYNNLQKIRLAKLHLSLGLPIIDTKER